MNSNKPTNKSTIISEGFFFISSQKNISFINRFRVTILIVLSNHLLVRSKLTSYLKLVLASYFFSANESKQTYMKRKISRKEKSLWRAQKKIKRYDK
jgi:hypothetical protein